MSILTLGERFDDDGLHPYGGVIVESMFIRSCFTGKTMTPGWGGDRTPTGCGTYALGTLSVIDLPITFLTDTLFLPYDAYSWRAHKQRERKAFKKKEEERLQWQRENANK